MDNLLLRFFRKLEQAGLSPASLRSYKSDLSHFLAWLTFKLQVQGIVTDSLSGISPYLTPHLACEYGEYLVKNRLSIKTTNRRLSALRSLGRFLFEEGLIAHNFMANIDNIPNPNRETTTLLEKYRRHLRSQKASENTIKNYLNDIRHFLIWLESQSQLVN